jgi:prepilin-type N-terminal cleavage/methylation domain-containing protein
MDGGRARGAGFSLVELLVVLAIVAILVGLLLAVIKPHPKVERTRTILAALDSAIGLATAQRGFMPSPAEHPFAGSRPPRPAFVRADGAAFDTGGEALCGPDLAQIDVAARGGLLLPDDVYADDALPLLFGMRRRDLGVPGAIQKSATKHRRLPRPAQGALPGPYDDAHQPGTLEPSDAQDADPSFGLPSASKGTLDYLFGASAAQGELTALGALFATPDPHGRYTHPLRPRRVGGVDLPLAFTDAASGADGEAHWLPGCVRDGTRPDGAPAWKHYKLPGLAVYDAWGIEILCAPTIAGLRMMSAGPDGVFRWRPGDDHRLQTAPTATAPAGDDRDGAKDDLGGP